jgi:hypothetical protein
MIMTQNKAQKSVIRQRMAETGEPYSVARRAVQAQPATAKDWDEEYYADGAASEGITVDEFKTREAADQESRGLPTVDAQAADGMPRPGWRQYRTASFGGVPPVPPMPPMPPVPPAPAPPGFPGASRFRGAARRASRPTQVPLTEDQARELGPFLEAAREAADRAEQAAALARELAVRAQQQAERTQERADLAEEWADEEEQEGSDEAQEQAEQAQERADLAEERAMQAQEWAELARERADEAREWADKAQEWPAV